MLFVFSISHVSFLLHWSEIRNAMYCMQKWHSHNLSVFNFSCVSWSFSNSLIFLFWIFCRNFDQVSKFKLLTLISLTILAKHTIETWSLFLLSIYFFVVFLFVFKISRSLTRLIKHRRTNNFLHKEFVTQISHLINEFWIKSRTNWSTGNFFESNTVAIKIWFNSYGDAVDLTFIFMFHLI